MKFTDDEIQTIKHMIEDWGFEYSLKANQRKIVELAKKLGLADYVKIYDSIVEA